MEPPEPPAGTAAGQEEQELRERAFFSWAEFSRFFDAWCQQRLALFFVKSSMHLARCRWASAPPLYTLIDVLKYSYVRLVCKDVRGAQQARRGVREPKLQPGQVLGPPQAGCPAFIIVKLSPLKDRLVVTECQLTHSHPACPLEFAYYFRPGHLLANACLPVRTTNRISKQFVAPADVRRLLAYCKGRDHGVLDALRVLEGLFRTDPEAKVKLVFVEDQAVVETVFFLTSRTRALLRRFSLMLLVDRLPGLQGALDLLAVLCVDGAGRARQAACCLARPGTPSLLRFALASLLQSAPEVKGRVRCLTAGPEVAAQLPAVRQLLPRARVQICRAQGLETLFSKAQELGGAGREDPGLWPRLCRLVGATSPTAYTEALDELRAHGPAAFVDYFERNWAPRRDMWVRFSAFEAAQDLDACALVRSHRRRLLRHLSPSRGVAQCLRDLVAMQWADAAGEAEPDTPEGRTARSSSQVDQENAKALEAGTWGGVPKERTAWLRSPSEKEQARGLENRDWTGARPESDQERGWPFRDWRGGAAEPLKMQALEGRPWRAGQQENAHWRAPEVRDWRGQPWERDKGWNQDRLPWLVGPQSEEQDPKGLEAFALRTVPSEECRTREPDATERRVTTADCLERPRGVEGTPWSSPQVLENRASEPNPRDWPGAQLETGQGRGLEAKLWRGRPWAHSPDLLLENGNPWDPRWREERQRTAEKGDERGVKVGLPKKGLEDVVLVQLGDARGATGLANGDARGVRPVDPAGRGRPEAVEWVDPGARGAGQAAGNGSPEVAPSCATTSHPYADAASTRPDGADGPSHREHQQLSRAPEERGPDWELLAKFRAACGPELAELVAEELAFARRHGTRGFRWTGAGFALQDGASDFILDRSLTRCSCSIHAARRLPCRHVFAARLLTGCALFHMDLLRDCWGRVPEP